MSRPVVPCAADHVHGADGRQLRGQRRRDGVRPDPRARGDHARGGQRGGRAERRARLAGLAAGLRRAGHHGRRHARARAPHPRGRRDARRRLPGRDGGGRGARADRRRAADDRPRPRARGDASPSRRSCAATAPARTCSRSTPGSRARSCATSWRAARRSSCCPARRPPRSCSHAAPTACSWCPDRATRRRSATSSTRSARRSGGCRCSASASATSCSPRRSGWRRSSCAFGHRGGNHPVKDLRTGRIAITAQNHGFAVRGEAGQRLQTDFGEAELTHVNLYDGTIEGLRLLDVPAGCVQYHPEAGPGPHDSVGLFDEFIARDPGRPMPCLGATTCTRSSCSAPGRS